MALEKIIDIPEPDLKKIRQDFESEGADIRIIPQSDGRYTITARFPDPLHVRILRPRNLLIAGLVLSLCAAFPPVWRLYKASQFHKELKDSGLPSDLYDRQGQFESLAIQQGILRDVNWLDSATLTDLTIESRDLNSLAGLVHTPEIQSFNIDLSGDIVDFEGISSLHRLRSLTLRGIGRMRRPLVPELAAFPELRKLNLDFERSSTSLLPDFAPCQRLQDLTLDLRSTNAITELPDLSGAQQLSSVALYVDNSKVQSLKPLARLDHLQTLALTLDGTQLELLAGWLSAVKVRSASQRAVLSGPKSLKLFLASPPNNKFPNLLLLPNLISLTLSLPGPRGSKLSDKTPVPDISYLENLQELAVFLNGSDIPGLPEIGHLAHLHTLQLDLAASGVQKLPNISQLHDLDQLTLNLSNTAISELPNFSQFSKLRDLNLVLANSKINYLHGIRDLGELRSLVLDIRAVNLRDLDSIAKLSGLEKLAVRLEWFQVGDLPNLHALKNLHVLEFGLDGWRKSEALPELGDLQAVEELTLNLTNSHIETLPDISRMAHLKKVTLKLQNSDIRDLSILEQVSNLEELELYFQGAIIERMPDLVPLKKLRRVVADIRHSTINLNQTLNLGALQELTIDYNNFPSLKGLPQSVKKLIIGP